MVKASYGEQTECMLATRKEVAAKDRTIGAQYQSLKEKEEDMKHGILVISLFVAVQAAVFLPGLTTGAAAANSTIVWNLKSSQVAYNCVGSCSSADVSSHFWLNGPMKGA